MPSAYPAYLCYWKLLVDNREVYEKCSGVRRRSIALIFHLKAPKTLLPRST